MFEQFNGRYDYTAIGNTLNPFENNIVQSFCETLPSSQATLSLENPESIIAAYLYWAGSGEADTNITLNTLTIDAEWIYNVGYVDTNQGELSYFSCVANVTELVLSQGNTLYELSDLDISETLLNNPGYCSTRTNFAGWALYVIFEDDTLPLNQINLFQGMEIINRNVQEKTIVLENLNVIDNANAKIGFLAWEGDNALNYGETLSINGNILSNPPLNPANNAFNGTNTFTNSNTFYNGDLDVYNIQNNIDIGDTSATIQLTTGGLDANGNFQADLIIINNIITVLNSQLPDAIIVLDNYVQNCGELEITLEYTVFNTNSTDILPANTPIAFYIDTVLVAQNVTQNDIAIGGNESGSTIIMLPDGLENSFNITINVDDNGSQIGTVTESNENNNTYVETIGVLPIPTISNLPNLLQCNEGLESAVFNLIDAISEHLDSLTIIAFYSNLSDLQANENELIFTESYLNLTNPQTIFIKVQGTPCFEIYQFNLLVENCPPYIPQGFSPNDDNINDWFNIQGLYEIFIKHELFIYNRYGVLVFEGNNATPWNGKSNRGLNNLGNLLPTGTYFYILNLNDAEFKPMKGWVYLNY